MGILKIKKKPKKASFTVDEPAEDDSPGNNAYRLRKHLKSRYKITQAKSPFEDDDFPTLPRDITSLSDEDLSKKYGELSAYAEYVNDVAAGYEVEFIFQENDSKIEDALARLEQVDTGSTKQVKDDTAFISEDARKKRAGKLEMKATYKILEAKANSIERNIKVLSREQTRREKVYDRRPGTNA